MDTRIIFAALTSLFCVFVIFAAVTSYRHISDQRVVTVYHAR